MSKARNLADVISGNYDVPAAALDNAASSWDDLSGKPTYFAGRKNLIINGAMQIWERSTSATIGGDSYVAADRWKGRDYGGPGDYVMALDTSDVPSGQSFSNTMKCTVGTTDTPGTYAYGIHYTVEGYDLSVLRPGTSDAQQATLSFWAKSSVAGTYCVSARSTSAASSYVFEYTLAANTWTKITHTIAAPSTTTPAWNTTNGQGVIFEWNLGAQTSKITSILEAWHDGNYIVTANQTDWIANSGATFHLTGVQLEVGSVATPFEHRSYGEELALCRRYYQAYEGSGARGFAFDGLYASGGGSGLSMSWAFPVQMRSAPSHTKLYNDTLNVSSVNVATTIHGVQIETIASGGGRTAYKANGSGYIRFDAEL